MKRFRVEELVLNVLAPLRGCLHSVLLVLEIRLQFSYFDFEISDLGSSADLLECLVRFHFNIVLLNRFASSIASAAFAAEF